MFNRSKKVFCLLGAGALALAALLPAGIGTAEAAEPTNQAFAANGASVSASGNEVADKWQAQAAIDGTTAVILAGHPITVTRLGLRYI